MDNKSKQSLSQIRGIRSYVLRQGHLTSLQKKMIEKLMPTWGIKYSTQLIDLNKIFLRENPKILEIGFGMGNTTIKMAKNNPDIDYLGIEVYGPGVGNLLYLIEQEKLTNIRIIRHDAAEVINTMLADNIFAGVHIFFPDPWPKKRHHKRRLIQSFFLETLVAKIKTGGYLHLATDWEDYAQQMLDVLNLNQNLANQFTDYAPKPEYRPETKFELRGKKLGHQVWDLIFNKV